MLSQIRGAVNECNTLPGGDNERVSQENGTPNN